MSRERWAVVAALVGGAAWGAFWVPIRALEKAGFEGFWSVAALWGGVALVAIPFLAIRRQQVLRGGWRLQLAGLLLGAAVAFYSVAFLYTEVVSAVLLYYLSPVWGFVLGWLILRDPITPIRWVAMMLALTGAAVLMGAETWPPQPNNVGDWLALAAGVLFVIGSLMMLTRPDVAGVEYILSFFFWVGVLSIGMAIAISGAAPDFETLDKVALWLFLAVILLAAPGSSATLYGASVLNPGMAGILYMSEIGVSLILAAILTEEPFGLRQGVGVAMISAACMAEGVWHVFSRWRHRFN